jgi:hypothetical protein
LPATVGDGPIQGHLPDSFIIAVRDEQIAGRIHRDAHWI